MITYDNTADVKVPALYEGDPDITITIMQCGVTESGGARYAYFVLEGGELRISGANLCGPAYGMWPEAADMARTLASFLGATYECGELTEHGESYSPIERMWLEVHAERFGLWASDMEEARS